VPVKRPRSPQAAPTAGRGRRRTSGSGHHRGARRARFGSHRGVAGTRHRRGRPTRSACAAAPGASGAVPAGDQPRRDRVSPVDGGAQCGGLDDRDRQDGLADRRQDLGFDPIGLSALPAGTVRTIRSSCAHTGPTVLPLPRDPSQCPAGTGPRSCPDPD
jgi:hypothetical protein